MDITTRRNLDYYSPERQTRADRKLLADAAGMYAGAFAEINGLAAQRHLMNTDEFREVWSDEAVEKWFAHDAAGELIGFGVQTTELDHWPLISPAYFERRWPKLYRQQRIWYVGFVCTRQGQPAPVDTFAKLIIAMSDLARASDGISVMDFCTANVTRKLPEASLRILRRARVETEMRTIDAQYFTAYDFGGNGLD